MALSDIDRKLLQRCLARKPRAWEDFVDRFMGLVVHVVNHSAQCRSIRLTSADRDDLTADVFLAVVENDFAVLRRFRGNSSLATYLTVVARRIVVRKLLTLSGSQPLAHNGAPAHSRDDTPEQRITDAEEVEHLLGQLNGAEADAVRLYHLEGKSYSDIGRELGLSESSIGPMLSRARTKMRRAGADTQAG